MKGDAGWRGNHRRYILIRIFCHSWQHTHINNVLIKKRRRPYRLYQPLCGYNTATNDKKKYFFRESAQKTARRLAMAPTP